ncbi:tannase/feruloyl esterase family alpha/beta hydrolase [Telluria beijingensis]|uniref:tannase/feruloyl esterase family alpha/beta hydrolase n=1 Tax=Telluria beijingensis TaxID=3068633 RepID=UPI003BF56C9C
MIYGAKRPDGVRLGDFKFTAEEAQEIRQLGAHYDAYDPDLRAFRDRGGKMIVWEGAADPSSGPYATLHYYQAVRDLLGGTAKTRDTMRVFMLPGVYHCRGGSMPYEANFLGAIVNWVEAGVAPDSVTAAAVKPDGGVRTRPIYAYPVRAQYTGKGSIDDAANFRGVAPANDPDDRYPWIGANTK